MNEDVTIEFLVTILAILVGLVIGKWVSRELANQGVPIAAGDPMPVKLGMPAA